MMGKTASLDGFLGLVGRGQKGQKDREKKSRKHLRPLGRDRREKSISRKRGGSFQTGK